MEYFGGLVQSLLRPISQFKNGEDPMYEIVAPQHETVCLFVGYITKHSFGFDFFYLVAPGSEG